MKIFRLSSPLSKNEIIGKSKRSGFMPLSPKLADSIEQFELAFLLAKKAFRNRTNIAKTLGLEFLLWLSGERDLRSAFAKNDFEPEDFLLVSFGKTDKAMGFRLFCAGEKPLSLKRSAGALELEKISLSRL